jgi:hypothetical protein
MPLVVGLVMPLVVWLEVLLVVGLVVWLEVLLVLSITQGAIVAGVADTIVARKWPANHLRATHCVNHRDTM